MTIQLIGGLKHGQRLTVSDRCNVLSFPQMSLRDDHAVMIRDDDPKRHGWDDDALRISYLEYERTDMESDDGTVFFRLKESL